MDYNNKGGSAGVYVRGGGRRSPGQPISLTRPCAPKRQKQKTKEKKKKKSNENRAHVCDPPAEISRSEQPDMSHIHFAPQCGSLCSWSGGPSGSVNNRVNVRETERGATAGTLFDSGFRLQQPSLVIRLFFFFIFSLEY